MGRHRYPAAHWENTSRRLYKSTYWETRCSYINPPESFSNTQYLLIAITIIWIFRRKTKSQSANSTTVMRQRHKIGGKVFTVHLVQSIWNITGPTNVLKHISYITTFLKKKLLLRCGDVEANPGPYSKGTKKKILFC